MWSILFGALTISTINAAAYEETAPIATALRGARATAVESAAAEETDETAAAAPVVVDPEIIEAGASAYLNGEFYPRVRAVDPSLLADLKTIFTNGANEALPLTPETAVGPFNIQERAYRAGRDFGAHLQQHPTEFIAAGAAAFSSSAGPMSDYSHRLEIYLFTYPAEKEAAGVTFYRSNNDDARGAPSAGAEFGRALFRHSQSAKAAEETEKM